MTNTHRHILPDLSEEFIVGFRSWKSERQGEENRSLRS